MEYSKTAIGTLAKTRDIKIKQKVQKLRDLNAGEVIKFQCTKI